MKPSSPDHQNIRPARLDRPLSRVLIPGYADAELEQILARAKAAAQADGHAAGYAAGWAQGRQLAAAEAEAAQAAARAQLAADQARLAERGRALLDSLAQAARAQQTAAVPAWHEVADLITQGVLTLTRTILDRELSQVTEPVREALTVAMRALGDPETVLIRVNPMDRDLLTPDLLPPGTQVISDASVAPGGVLAVTPTQRMEVCLPVALAAAQEVLLS